MQPPAQELQARDIHDTVWTFRHIFRGGENIPLSVLQNGSISRTFAFLCKYFPPEARSFMQVSRPCTLFFYVLDDLQKAILLLLITLDALRL